MLKRGIANSDQAATAMGRALRACACALEKQRPREKNHGEERVACDASSAPAGSKLMAANIFHAVGGEGGQGATFDRSSSAIYRFTVHDRVRLPCRSGCAPR